MQAPIFKAFHQLVNLGRATNPREVILARGDDDKWAILKRAIRDQFAVTRLEDVQRQALAGKEDEAEGEEAEVARFVAHGASIARRRTGVGGRRRAGILRGVTDASRFFRASLANVQPYVAGRPASDVRRELGLEQIVKLGSNETPFAPMPGALRAINEHAAGVRGYPEGDWALREALSNHLGVPADWVLTGNGVDSLIKVLCASVLDPGERLLMGWPSFISWRQAALLAGSFVTQVPLAVDGAYDLDRMLAAVDQQTKIVVVVSPNNPTGAAVGSDALAAFAVALPEHVLLAIDEAYWEYLPEGGHDAVALVRASGRPIVAMRTFSKAYALAGLRVGYLVAQPEIVRELTRVRNAFDVNALAQVAAIASLADGAEHLAPRVDLARNERARVADGLRALGLSPLPSDANFLFVDLGVERAAAVNAALLARGVIVRPAGPFGAPEALRFTIGWPDENQRLLEALAEALAESA